MFKPHVTLACVVQAEGKFLLVEEMINGKLTLNQPAGHLEANETLLAAARRNRSFFSVYISGKPRTVPPSCVLPLYWICRPSSTPPRRTRIFPAVAGSVPRKFLPQTN